MIDVFLNAMLNTNIFIKIKLKIKMKTLTSFQMFV